MNLHKLPESELEIMKILWEAGEPVLSTDIMERLPEEKEWKLTTVLTLLSRLIEKQFAASEGKARLHRYYPLVQEKDYLQTETEHFFKKMHKGSLKSLIATLYESEGLSEKDIKELEDWMKERGKGDV
jgi:predicted transcriptional regulator